MWRITFWLIYEPDLGGESDAEDRSWNLEEGKSSTIVRNFDRATHTTDGHISIKVERKFLIKHSGDRNGRNQSPSFAKLLHLPMKNIRGR